MYDLAAEQDGELVHLEIGEPDFDTPAHVVDAAARAAEDGETHYTANAGIAPLREAIADDLQRSPDPSSEVLVAAGAMEALFLALGSVVDDGDEVVVPSPAWPNYFRQVELAGGTPVDVPMDPADGFDLDADRVREAITPETSAVVLNSPSNPTGRVFDEDAVAAVVEAAVANDAVVVADEVYKDLVYEGEHTSVASSTDHEEHVLTVGSCSKTFAMTGWRVGWLAGPEPVVTAATRLHENTTACASSVSQHAALAALTGPREPVEEMRSTFAGRREYVADRLSELPVVDAATPEGAFYTFVDCSRLDRSSMELATLLLEEYGVVTAPGGGFGQAGEGHLRLSFANSQDRLEAGLDRFETMLGELEAGE